MITDMRSASVNNDCYALSAVKVGLHKHLLHASPTLHRDIANTLRNSDKFASTFTYGWESDTSFPKVSNCLNLSTFSPISVSLFLSLLIVTGAWGYYRVPCRGDFGRFRLQ